MEPELNIKECVIVSILVFQNFLSELSKVHLKIHSNLDIVNKSVSPLLFTISNVICLVNPQNGSWVLFTIVWNSLYWGSLYQGLSALGKHKAPVRNRKYKLRNAISIFKNALMFNCLFTKDHPPSDSELGIMCFPNL